MQFLQRRSLPSIRAKLVTLVLACALPILVGYLIFAHDADQRERIHVAEDAEMAARALAAAVERDLANGEIVAQALANDSSLGRGDLAAFHAAARRLLRPELSISGFTLSGPDGHAVLDTRHPYGAPPPAGGNEADVRQVFARAEAVASGLHRGAASQPWVISIAVPVWRGGKVAYALSVELRPRRLAELLADQHLPARWNAQVFDERGLLVARTGDATRTIGMPMRPELATALARAGIGMVAADAAGGSPVDLAYARTMAHGWTVAVGFPRQAARELLGPAPGAALAVIAAMLAISLGLAWRIGGSIARSVRALTAPAAALGRGEALAIPPLAIREAASVARALRKVESELEQYRAGLEARVAERTDALQRSSMMLATVYATAPVGLAFLDRSLKIVMVNDYLATVNGLAASAHVGRTLPELLGERGVAIELPYRRVLASGRPLVDVEDSGESPAEPGRLRHWICSYYPVYGPGRELVGINAVVLDITERRRQEQRDRDNEVLYRTLFEGSGDAHMLLVHDAGFVSANQATIRLFGCRDAAEFLTMSPATASPEFQPDGRRSDQLAQEHMQRALREGMARFEWIHRRRDGSVFHADVLLNRVDIDGSGMLQATVRDISARVATQAALSAAGARLEHNERMIRAITDHLPALVGYWDDQLRCQFANRPYLDWLGRSAGQVIGRTVHELLDAEQIAQVEPFARAVFAGTPQFFERRLRRAGSGEVMQAWGSYIPDFDATGKVRGFYTLHADITELKRTQSRLEDALHAAEAASSAKSAFLANISHEIRTPMNAIIGLARLLEEADLGRREHGYVERMQMAAHTLLSMLNDVLDYSKVEAGRLVLERTGFALDDVLSSIGVLNATSAWNKGIEPVFAVQPGVPARRCGDPMRLQQVLLNLVSNAIKFTERGEVVLEIALAGPEDEPVPADTPQESAAQESAAQDGAAQESVRLAFTVRDTGIGIAPGQQQRMFEAFSQADSSTSRKYGGTGLGLAISRRLVDLLGGVLEVDSAAGRGARFRFSARFGVAAGHAEGAGCAPGGAPLAGLRILVADDNGAGRAALADLLSGWGAAVDGAAGGAAALALLRAGPAYDMAFIDGAMPDLDGAAVLAAARADGIALPRCALLAADPERERLAALAPGLGAGAVLAKPFTPRALCEAVAELRGSAAPAPRRRPAPLRGGLAGLRVLVVEDNLMNQEVAKYVLTHAGAGVEFAGNGRLALDLLAAPGAGARYDAVLMDLQMPVMDGFEATAAIRALGLDALPIIAMTANAMEEDRRRALAAGMNDYLAKPIDVDDLVATLARSAGRQAPASVGASGTPAPAMALAPAPPALALAATDPAHIDLPGIDLHAALPRFGGSFADFAAVFARFPAAHADVPEQIRACLARGDRDGAGHAAHRLRGVAANLGALDVARHALAVEQALHGAQTAVAPALAQLEQALATAAATARAMPQQRPSGPGGAVPAGTAPTSTSMPACTLHEELAHLLDLLQNNNMKALAHFDALHPALARVAPARTPPLAEAVAALRFEAAGALVRAILDTEENA
ncbi:response regulator [Massilia forsythiae]|uniref:Virulence sensor protein BvgS n=1 Tax=Massilia forsythiae TaxID=2728020 RepID=A0A7Z2W2L0_9BURK|nr:response regulator [Massilia forsythiae]